MRRTPTLVALGLVVMIAAAGTLPLAESAENGPSPEDARRLLAAGAYEQALAAARVSLENLAAAGQADSVTVATCLEVAASALMRLGRADGDEAQTLAEQALEIRTRIQGADHPDTSGDMVILAGILRSRRQMDPARQLYDRALAIRRATFGEESLEYVEALNGLAGLLFTSGDIAASLPLYEVVLMVRKARLPADHADLGDALYNLGNVHRNLGDLETAKGCYGQAVTIFEKAFGKDHINVAGTLNNLALTYKAEGDWSSARAASERALSIYESVLGPQHPYVAGLFNNLASLAEKLGDDDQSLALLERSLAIREKVLGPDHPDVAQALNNIGDLLRRKGRYEEARLLLERSLAIREKALGPHHPHVARTLSSLGELLIESGDLAGGAALIERGLSIEETSLGPEHREVAGSLTDLAMVELARGRPEKARTLAERAVSILAAVVGENHPDWADAALILARAASAAGDRALALTMALRSEDAARTHLQLTAPLLTEREALSYAAIRSRGRDLALHLLDDETTTPSDRTRVWEATVAARGIVLEALLERASALAESRSPAIASLRREFDKATGALAAELVKPPRGPAEAVRQQLEEDRQQRDAAERALALASAAAGGRLQRHRLTQTQISGAMPARSALVSYVRYRRTVGNTKDGEPAYLAFVLRPGAAQPAAIGLGPATTIDNLVAEWFDEVSTDSRNGGRTLTEALLDYRRAGRALRQAIWDPLLPALGDASLVFVVPDGALHLVTIPTLPVGHAEYLLERGPTVHRLGSERELLLLAPGGRSGDGLLALGAARLQNPSTNGAEVGDGALSGRPLGPLPGAAQEVEEIAATWAAAAGSGPGEVTLLTGEQASESAFKSLAPGRRAVHIATHGFYTAAAPGGATSRGVGGLTGTTSLPGAILLEGATGLAGLLLSPDPPDRENGDDGVVTAPEISLLDLSSVEWTVLSACNTGRGALHASEGVIGLERAFRAAGSRTVVVSLWPADDMAAREWMTALYRARLGSDASTADAVRSAARHVLDQRRAALTSHPYAWGAFVATGDWR